MSTPPPNEMKINWEEPRYSALDCYDVITQRQFDVNSFVEEFKHYHNAFKIETYTSPDNLETADVKKRMEELLKEEKEVDFSSFNTKEEQMPFNIKIVKQIFENVSNFITKSNASKMNCVLSIIEISTIKLLDYPTILNPLLYIIWKDLLNLYRELPQSFYSQFFKTILTLLNSSPQFMSSKFFDDFVPLIGDFVQKYKQGMIRQDFIVNYLEFSTKIHPQIYCFNLSRFLTTFLPFLTEFAEPIKQRTKKCIKRFEVYGPYEYNKIFN